MLEITNSRTTRIFKIFESALRTYEVDDTSPLLVGQYNGKASQLTVEVRLLLSGDIPKPAESSKERNKGMNCLFLENSKIYCVISGILLMNLAYLLSKRSEIEKGGRNS